MFTENTRTAILELHKKGLKNTKTAKLLKLNRTSVWRTIKRFKELNLSSDRTLKGRPQSARTTKTIYAVKEKIRRCPNRSIRKLSKEHQISERSTRRIVREDL